MRSTAIRLASALFVSINLLIAIGYAADEPRQERPLGVDGLPAACRVAKANFRPLTKPDLEKAKAKLTDALARLDRRLGAAGENGVAWREYLQWDRLREQFEADEPPELEVLDGVYGKFAAGHEALGWNCFADVRQTLRRYLIVARALDNSQLQAGYEEVLEHLAEHLTAYATKPSTDEALRIAEVLRWLEDAQQAPALSEAVRRRYGSANLLLMASSDLIAAGIAGPVDKTGPVRDVILGTSIHGTGHTTGQRSVELVSDDERAVVDVVFLGTTKTQTIGYNGPVRIYSNGTTPIGARKRFRADATGLVALPAVSKAATKTRINNIQSNRGSRLVQRIAWKKALGQKSQAEYIASRHAEQRVNRQIDEEAVEMIDRANKKYLDRIREPLLRRELFPQMIRLSTDNDAVRIVALRADTTELAAPGEPPPLDGQADLGLRIHQSMINNLAAGGLSGMILRAEMLESALVKLLGKLPERLRSDEDEEPWTIYFGRRRPISVTFADDGFIVTVSGRRFYEGESRHPGMDVTATYKIAKAEEGFKAIRQGDLQVFPPGFVPGGGKRLSARQTVIRTILRRRLGRIFGEEIVVGDVVLSGKWEKAGKMRPIQVDCRDGWMTVAWKRVPSDQPAEKAQVEQPAEQPAEKAQ